MKTTTIRELKHATSRVLGWAEQGEEVQITRRGKALATLQPLPRSKARTRPDFAARLSAIYGDTSLATTATELISEARGER
jgi:antitoxin (DNA-binding transcriptional repressor) of toxin-antitoxin stability system